MVVLILNPCLAVPNTGSVFSLGGAAYPNSKMLSLGSHCQIRSHDYIVTLYVNLGCLDPSCLNLQWGTVVAYTDICLSFNCPFPPQVYWHPFMLSFSPVNWALEKAPVMPTESSLH